jgi:hypothetical protein
MNRKSALLNLASIAIALSVGPGIARALHLDVMPEQINGQIVTGTADYDHDLWTLGERVFHRDFGSTYANNNPGYTSIGAGSPDMPAGAQALTGNLPLSWDFLPMTITNGNNSLSQNLFYWNGQDTDGVPGLTPNDVKFSALPGPNYTLTLFDNNNVGHATNGTNTIVPGGTIATTGSDGFVHQHLYYFLQDNDGNSATTPADGLYLVTERMKLPGLANSLPVFFIFGTPGSSVSAEDDAAVPWVEQQLNVPGDYNRNGVVDAADYALWRKTLNSSASPLGSGADGNGDGSINVADYTFWRQHFGQVSQLIVNTGSGAGSSKSLEAFAVPESASSWLLILGCALILGCNTRRRSIGRMTVRCSQIRDNRAA